MNKSWSRLVRGAWLALALGGTAQATVITATVGDNDGFGTKVQDGETFDLLANVVAGPGDATDTDTVLDGGASIPLSYTLPVSPTSGTLTIFSGGWGTYGPAVVKLNGTFIGKLTDGEDDDGTLRAHLDGFTLTSSQLALLTGNDIVSIEPEAGTEADGGVIDYVELTLNTDALPPALPEPASLGLAGVALALLAGQRRSAKRAASH